jgi:hypothetical protein
MPSDSPLRRLEAWRVACVTYRKVRQAGELDQRAWLAARAAITVRRQECISFDSLPNPKGISDGGRFTLSRQDHVWPRLFWAA